MARAVQGSRRRGGAHEGIGVGGADRAHGGGTAVLLVVGMKDEQDVESFGQRRVGVVAGLSHLPEHREEVLGEAERVVRIDEGHADAEAVAGGRQRWHLGDEADDLLVPVGRVVDLVGLRVEG